MIEADSDRHIDFAFALARRFDRDVQMHVDESDDPGARTLHAYAVAAIKAGWHGRVTADHVTALAAYDDNYAAKVIVARGPGPDERGHAADQAHARAASATRSRAAGASPA